MTTETHITLTGHQAITYAEAAGRTLAKHADPTEDARDGLSVDEALDIAAGDPSLVYIEVPRVEELEVCEANDGTIWIASPEERIAIDMGRDPQDLDARALTDLRTYRSAWSPEDFEDDLHPYSEVEDDQTRHVASYRPADDRLTLWLDGQQMGHSARAYFRLDLEEEEGEAADPGEKVVTVVIAKDVEVAGYGIFRAGSYRVAMPASYDPEGVTAEDIVHDGALRTIRD